jgi:hypothetical protein
MPVVSPKIHSPEQLFLYTTLGMVSTFSGLAFLFAHPLSVTRHTFVPHIPPALFSLCESCLIPLRSPLSSRWLHARLLLVSPVEFCSAPERTRAKDAPQRSPLEWPAR